MTSALSAAATRSANEPSGSGLIVAVARRRDSATAARRLEPLAVAATLFLCSASLVVTMPQLTTDEGSRLEQKRHRFPNVEHSRMIRIEADARRTNLAITLFALLDARADATLTTEQSRTVRTAVSLRHRDTILGLPVCIRVPLNFGRHLRPRHEAPSDCRRNAHPRRRAALRWLRLRNHKPHVATSWRSLLDDFRFNEDLCVKALC